MSVQIAEKEKAAPPIAPTIATSPSSDEEWELEVSISDAPHPVATDDCDTSDGCESSCASSCTSD
ncbi:FxLD family lanthipeptide [Streptomyces sp. 110]|uniref:FxLD family lanthipeptide n=1 Tax=Streptomyces endocoffeicus TaxID=2898945 RepID=A0ABS1Q757_9ACTN|nr:FxLD family lanthipeptide [Streptomyces endocoffeicus]MBL1120507.1 FxLD family lanthipeptide [Streptomyces endocoffeicus]